MLEFLHVVILTMISISIQRHLVCAAEVSLPILQLWYLVFPSVEHPLKAFVGIFLGELPS